MDHALTVAIEHPFEARYTPRNCILDTVRDLRFEVEDSEDKTAKEVDGWEIGGCLLLSEKMSVATESVAISAQKKHEEEGQNYFVEKDAAEKDEALPLEALAVSELEQLANRSWGGRRWEDLSQKYHRAGWLTREKMERWHEELKRVREKRRTCEPHCGGEENLRKRSGEKGRTREKLGGVGKKLRNVGKAQRGSRQD